MRRTDLCPRRLLGQAGVCLAWGAVLLLASFAHARAGGGEGFGGGGGGGGFGGGGGGWGGGGGGWGGGGGGGSIHVDGPAGVVIFLVIVIVVMLLVLERFQEANREQTIRKAHNLRNRQRQAEMVAAMKAADPAFDPEVFFQRVRAAFMKIQHAWSTQDISSIRPFISDGVHERFSIQIDEQRWMSCRNQVEQISIRGVSLEHVAADGAFQTLSVRIDASAADYYVSLDDGQHLRGSLFPAPFSEIWSFVRRTGAHSLMGRDGLIEGNCPNCGAAVAMNQHANCQHCSALLRSGLYDWVLAEITQISEWEVRDQQEAPGVAGLRRCDGEFNTQHLEDLASVIFWRIMAADRLCNIEPMRKLTNNAYTEAYREHLETRRRQNGAYEFWAQCGVGSVRTGGIIPGEGFDTALVTVRWSGRRHVARSGTPPFDTGESCLASYLLVLKRRTGARSDPGRSISSAHCPKCGGPETTSASNACDFCGTVLNDGSRSWVLAAVYEGQSREARELHLQARSPEVPESAMVPPIPESTAPGRPPATPDLLHWAIRLALADHHIDQRERRMLDRLAEKAGLSPQQVQVLISAAKVDRLECPEPADNQQARIWMGALVETSLADGHIHPQEWQLLRQLGQRIRWSKHDIDQLIRRKRNEMYATAKARLRNGR